MSRVSIGLFVMIHGCLSLGDDAGRSDGGASVDVMYEDRSIDVTADGAMSAGCTGPDRTVCNGVCVPLTTDENCGGCGTACAITSGERCVRASTGGSVDGGTTPDGGARVAFCQVQCPTGQVLCGNGCRDLTNDPNHCRTCGNQCLFPNAVAGCTGSACVLSSCREGFGNCDNNPANGCETTTSTDATNCGVCGNRCGFANAAAACGSGVCQLGACNAGFANCDGNASNGCETNVAMGDVTNCGGCGTRCPAPPTGATAVCSSSVCRLSTVVCAIGTGNCDGNDGNGCEVTTLNNVNNCGMGGPGAMVGCGNVCPRTGGTASCVGGVCNLACTAGLANCDGNASNGCETDTNSTVAHCGGCGRVCPAGQLCSAGLCLTVCSTGQAMCSGACRDLQTDNTHCGACGRTCTGGTVCVAGTCACPAGRTACSGSCRALQTDTNHCGLCGNICAGGQTCVAGVCATLCATGQTACSGVCRDLRSDNSNCGSCGRTCTGGTACAAGNCACPTGQTTCSGTCRALRTDNANCGACGNICSPGTVCSGGMCTASCASPTTNCSGVCRELQNDVNNCNACGAVCSRANAAAGCAAGVCTLAACNSGFGNCDTNPANGCEVNTSTSVTNCGACGNGCQFANAAASCVAGRCTRGACAAGFANCDGVDSNGCEVNTVAGDINHCGACNNPCPAPSMGSIAVCANSTCTTSSVSCPSDRRDCNAMSADGCEVALTTVANCGACGRACVSTNGTATCVAQLCGINCSAGFGNCNGLLSDGCETNTSTNPTNCGGCNTVCSLPNATAGCAAGACTIASCNAGFANCDGNPANGCEVNLNSDTANCGACSTPGAPRACGAGQLCSAGACLTTCGSGQSNCSGVCRNLTSDADACGACGTVCSGTGVVSRTCGAGVCNGICSAGRANCDGDLQGNGCEVDTNTSVTRCGGCSGMACSSSNIAVACSGGNCTGNCNVGFADCNSDKRADGCEVNTTNDARHCGGCGRACPAGQMCVAGSCMN